MELFKIQQEREEEETFELALYGMCVCGGVDML